MLDKMTGRSRGFAFVEFSIPEEANKAVEMFHCKDLGGRVMTVNIARPREERPPGDRPRGGYGSGGGGGYGGGNRGFRESGDRGGRSDWGDRGGREDRGGWRGDRE